VPVVPEPELPDPELPDPAGWEGTISGLPTAGPADATPPVDAAPAFGVTAGSAHMAPGGHGVGPGRVPTGGQAAACVHPPVVLVPDP